jgi:hypothetical protein
LQATGVTEFNRWVGWATIAALPVAAVGLVLLVWEKFARSLGRSEMSGAAAEDELAALVLAQGQVTRSRLIGTDEVGDQAANVRFVKGSGRFREVGGASEGGLLSVLEYYQSLSPGRMVVLGEPGAGKTVLALELIIRLLEQRKPEEGAPVPVLVSAAAYDTTAPWDEWLATHLARQFSIGTQVAARLVRDGQILPVLDGLDEMGPPGDAERARTLVMALNSYMRGRERAAVVVTCRFEEYQALGKNIDRATHIEMIPLTGYEAAAYLSDQLIGEQEGHLWEPVLADLRANPHGLLASQLATPWRLTLALTVFRDLGDPVELLPGPALTPTADQYAQRVDRLLLSRYVSAKVRLHTREGGYTRDQVQRWLIALAAGLDWQARHGGSGTDIQLDRWWRTIGRRVPQLAHVVMVAALGVPWLVIATVGHQPSLAITGAAFLAFAILAGFPSRPARLKVGHLTSRRFVMRLPLWLIGGLVFGLLDAIPWGRPVGLAGPLVAGFTMTLVAALLIGMLDSSPQTVGPRDVIRADGRTGLAFGLVFGLVVGLVFGLAGGSGLLYGLAVGVTFGLAATLSSGAFVWTRYHIGVVIGAVRGSGPISFGAFLDWAQQAGLLRSSGIAYQFRHKQLQDWLAQFA